MINYIFKICQCDYRRLDSEKCLSSNVYFLFIIFWNLFGRQHPPQQQPQRPLLQRRPQQHPSLVRKYFFLKIFQLFVFFNIYYFSFITIFNQIFNTLSLFTQEFLREQKISPQQLSFRQQPWKSPQR